MPDCIAVNELLRKPYEKKQDGNNTNKRGLAKLGCVLMASSFGGSRKGPYPILL